MRTLIVSDSSAMAEQILGVLARNQMECPPGHTVVLDAAGDRASRMVPSLVILVLPPSTAAGLETLRDICRTVPNVHVLVVGPATDPKVILSVLHAGAEEYLDEVILEGELAGALARFKARAAAIPVEGTVGWVISVLAPSGGSGSSTVAANVSATLAQQHGQCGLIDLRLSAGDLTSMLDLRPTHSIADLCDHLSRLDQSMFDQFFARHASGVALLAAPTRFADIPRVTAKGVRQTLAMARVRFPYVVVDLNDAFGGEQIEALWQSDVILLILRLDYTSVRNTRRTLENLGHIGIDLGRVRVVVNGYGERKQLTVAQAEEALGAKIAHSVPSDPASINLAINRGVPAVLCCPSGKASRSLRQLAAGLNGHSRKAIEREEVK